MSQTKSSQNLTNRFDYIGNRLENLLFPYETSKVEHIIDEQNNALPYIVFLEKASDQRTLEDRSKNILNQVGASNSPVKILNELNGFIVEITSTQAENLKLINEVKLVESDSVIYLEPPVPEFTVPDTFQQQSFNDSIDSSLNNYGNTTTINGEILPWGVRAVWQGEDITKKGNFASDTYAFVIDSGVSNSTDDLNLASNGGWHRSWISGETPFADGNGHGTHVAGTIGALVNGKGVIGVAPGAQIISLKVFDSSGGGASHTTIIEAIDYALSVIKNNALDKNKVVINMSLSGLYSAALETAIFNAADQGIRICVAAGNNGSDADRYTPASAGDHPNVFTVSAVDSNYRMPFWSNWDRLDSNDRVDDVDFSAPGANILSYYKDGQLAYLSGTSMAAPHVAGLLITGGVQAGDFAIPCYSDTSDPFALSKNQSLAPSIPPTYTLTSNTSVDEGQTIKVDVLTTNVSQGTILYWRVSGNGINAKDFVGMSDLQGSAMTDANGNASIAFAISDDKSTENDEVMRFELFSDANRFNRVGERSVAIKDTSKTIQGSTLWGTQFNDVITGTSGNDRICGVPASGTSAESLGRGQIDVLTGGAGADVFVLGDSRGPFYDDGIKNNIGRSDYALITDFKVGEDKLQLKKGNSYIFDVSNGNLSLYLDLNRNRSLESSGVNQDDLIAILQGVTTLGNSDLIMI